MAPADVPEIPSIWSQGSSNNRSSTPQAHHHLAAPAYENGFAICQSRLSAVLTAARTCPDDLTKPTSPPAKKTNLTVNHKLHFAGCHAASSLLSVRESTFRARPQKPLEVARDGFDACPRNVRVME